MITVTLIGRPNVGKSTLFNRLIKKKIALTHKKPGMTRDRKEYCVDHHGYEINFIDSAGLFSPYSENKEIEKQIDFQTEAAIEKADLIFFVIDGISGILPIDFEIYKKIRKLKKDIWVIINKAEKDITQTKAESYRFSKNIYGVSAEHNLGIRELIEDIERYYPKKKNDIEHEKEDILKITIIGKPNVGKSTLINTFLGENRLITADMAGVTRDSIMLPWMYENYKVELIDTAGMRKKNLESIEKLSVDQAKNVIRFTHAVILVIDASIPLEEQICAQDLHLADYILKEGRVLVLALNKWDQAAHKKEYIKHIQEQLSVHLSQGKNLPLIPIIAKNEKCIDLLMKPVLRLYEMWNKKIGTGVLNRWLEEAILHHKPSYVNNKLLKIKYITQIKTRPPTFALFTNLNEIPQSYLRYLKNSFKNKFKTEDIPIRFKIKQNKSNPYI